MLYRPTYYRTVPTKSFLKINAFIIENQLEQTLHIQLFHADEESYRGVDLPKGSRLQIDVDMTQEQTSFSFTAGEATNTLKEIRFGRVSLWDYLELPTKSRKYMTYSGQFILASVEMINFEHNHFLPTYTDPDGIAYGPNNVTLSQSLSGSAICMSLGLAG